MGIDLTLFIVTSLLIIISPGQDLVLVVSRGISHGSKAGLFTAGGVSLGLLGHTALAALGLGALLMASELLFSTIKTIGAVYLIYLGCRLLVSKGVPLPSQSSREDSLKNCLISGMFSNISNPKVTLFYFAYLPQFVDAAHDSTFALLLLGGLFAILTFLVKGPVGIVSGYMSSWVLKNQTLFLWFNRASGTILIGIGVRLATEQR